MSPALDNNVTVLPMHPTRNDIALEDRKGLVQLLNARLADNLDLAMQCKQAHWNVKGPSFIALHELFDVITGVIRAATDDIAERAIQLGGTAAGTAQVVASSSQLPAYPLDAVGGQAHAAALADAMAEAGKHMRAAIDAAEALNDADTADLFTGVSRDLDKYLWMVEAHLEGSN